MDALDGHVLFRVADATGDPLPTIARLAALSRAFARVARAELWPLYCLSRAAHADAGDAAAVVARLVREAGAADAPRNAASSLVRCVSACPGMSPACSAALRVHAATPLETTRVGGGWWARGWDADRGEEEAEGSGDDGGSGGVGGGEGSEEHVRESSGSEGERGEGGRGEGGRGDAAGGGGSGSSAGSGGCERGAGVAPTDPTDSTPDLRVAPNAPTAPASSSGAAPAASSPPVNPHLDAICALCAHLAQQIFRADCFLPAPPYPPPPAPPCTPLCRSPSSPSLSPCPPLGEEKTVGEGEGGGSGGGGGGVEEGVGETGEGVAVVMRTRGCGAHWGGNEHCCVVRGAIAGFRHSRFHWLLQGQPFAHGTCPFCHDQAWDATALLQPSAHTVLGCTEGDACCFICTQGHVFGAYKARHSAFDWDEFSDDVDGDDQEGDIYEDGDYDDFSDAFDDYGEYDVEAFDEPNWF
ncbi:hypothetical protein CLOM_g10674 [Closterium sp. NIES-68]|nr:hypothetical protein CLOM_g10674 [Closterium sp. NIES-68]GJP71105.1 hypothetical protein CLOP_g1958 [Closterium sp. NIES-67]